MALKAELRWEMPGYYDQALPGSEQAQREVGEIPGLAGETLAEMGRRIRQPKVGEPETGATSTRLADG